MNKNIKLLGVAILACGVATTALATSEGMYFGVNAGMSKLNNKTRTITINPGGTQAIVSPNNTGFGGGFFFGYQTNDYFGMEMAYTYYTPSTYTTSNLPANGLCSNPTIKQSVISINGKGTFPIGTSGFGVFGKGGLGIVYQSLSGSLVSTTGICGGNGKRTNTSARPMYGIGVSYDFSQNWVADLTYSHITSGGSTPAADLVSLGASYHIVNKRCGQFLC